MKRAVNTRYLRRIAVSLLMLLFAAPAFAQQAPERIHLIPGGRNVALEGDVARGSEAVYVFSAATGSIVTCRIVSKAGAAGFAVTDEEGRALPEEEFYFNQRLTGTLENEGDYRITVSTFESAPTHYKLTVRIRH